MSIKVKIKRLDKVGVSLKRPGQLPPVIHKDWDGEEVELPAGAPFEASAVVPKIVNSELTEIAPASVVVDKPEVLQTLADVAVVQKNSLDETLKTENKPGGVPIETAVNDINLEIESQFEDTLYNQAVPVKSQKVVVNVPAVEVDVKNSQNTTVASKSVTKEDNEIPLSNITVTQKNSEDQTIKTVENVPGGVPVITSVDDIQLSVEDQDEIEYFTKNDLVVKNQTLVIPRPPVLIGINGEPLTSVKSGDAPLEIEVVNEQDEPTGEPIGGKWVVAAAPPIGVHFDFPYLQQWNSYRDGDEGFRNQAGWNNITVPANPAVIAQLDDSIGANYWFQMKEALSVGGVSNVQRFVDVAGGQDFSAIGNKDLVGICKLTSLMFTRTNFLGALNWDGNIDLGLSHSITVDGVTYDDWYLLSLPEAVALFGSFFGRTKDDPITAQRIYDVDINGAFPLSTTLEFSTTSQNLLRMDSSGVSAIYSGAKTLLTNRILVRKASNLITAP